MFKNSPDRVYFTMQVADLGTLNGIIQISTDAMNVCQLCNFDLSISNLKRCDAFLTFITADMDKGWFEIPAIALANEFHVNTISPSPVSHHLYLEATDYRTGTGKFGGKPLKVFEQEITSMGFNLIHHCHSIVNLYQVDEITEKLIYKDSTKPFFLSKSGFKPIFEKKYRVEPVLEKNSNYVSTIYYQEPCWAKNLYLPHDLDKYFEPNPNTDPPYFHPSTPRIFIQTDEIGPIEITDAIRPYEFLNVKQHPKLWFDEIKTWTSIENKYYGCDSIRNEIYSQVKKLQGDIIDVGEHTELFYKFNIVNESENNNLDDTIYDFTLVFIEKNKIYSID